MAINNVLYLNQTKGKILAETAKGEKKFTPEDIAKVILFLSDDEQCKKVTGTVFEIHSNE